MRRNYKLFIDDIRESIELIEKYSKGITEKEFRKNQLIQDAIIRRIEIIGEASKNIPSSIKKINGEIPWKDLSNYRNFIVHSYFEASLVRVWKTIKKEMPELKEKLKKVKLK